MQFAAGSVPQIALRALIICNGCCITHQFREDIVFSMHPHHFRIYCAYDDMRLMCFSYIHVFYILFEKRIELNQVFSCFSCYFVIVVELQYFSYRLHTPCKNKYWIVYKSSCKIWKKRLEHAFHSKFHLFLKHMGINLLT